MRSRIALCTALVLALGALAPAAGSAQAQKKWFWTSGQAAKVVLASDWGKLRRLSTATCKGFGKARTVSRKRLFERFECRVTNGDTQDTFTIRLHVVGAKSFVVTRTIVT